MKLSLVVPAALMHIALVRCAESVPEAKSGPVDPSYVLRTECHPDQPFTYHGCAIAVGNKLLVTCAHNVDVLVQDAPEIFVKVGRDWLHCDLVSMDRRHDVAILRCDVELDTIKLNVDNVTDGDAEIKGTKKARKVEPIKVTVKDGKVTGKIEQGTSGSAMLKDGKLFGMVTGFYEKEKMVSWVEALWIQKCVNDVKSR